MALRRPSHQKLIVLRERDYRLLFSAQATSLLGDEMVAVALAFGVLARGGGASGVGLVLAARMVALVAFLLGGGVIGDRLPRRAVLVTTDLIRVASQGGIAAVLLAGGTSLWPIVALSAVTGAANGVFNPTATGFLPSVVPAQHLQQANALRSLASSGGRIAGPLLAGLLTATAGAGYALALDALTYAISAALVAAISVSGARAPGAPAASFLHELRGGWTAFRARTWVVAFVLASAVGNLCTGAWRVLGPVIADDRLGGAGAWSAIIAASGVGGVLGGILALRSHPRRPLVVASLAVVVLFIPMALLAAGAGTALVAATALVGEIGLVVANTIWESALQRHVEPQLLSRVSAYDWLGSFVFAPLGLALWGPIATLTGNAAALTIAAALGVVSTIAIVGVRDIRELSDAPPR